MKAEIYENEIMISLNKTDYKRVFGRIPLNKKFEDYFEYLLELDETLNGNEEICYGHLDADSFKESLKTMSEQDIEKQRNELIEDLSNYIDYIYDAVPSDYTYTSECDNIVMIPENDLIAYLKLVKDKLMAILQHNKQVKEEE